MNFPLNISTKRIFKGELNEETSILKADPTFDFDKELENARNQYDELLKELVDRWNAPLNEFDIFTADSWNKLYDEKSGYRPDCW